MRRLKHADEASRLDSIVEQLPKRRPRPQWSAAKLLERSSEEVAVMRKTCEWTGAKGRHLVALYAWLHNEIYGVGAEELGDRNALFAASNAAERMVRDAFGGDTKRAVQFIAWAWARERMREKAGKVSSYRITWRFMFASRSLLTDYRVELVRGSTR